MGWKSNVTVNTAVTTDAGWCLWLAEESTGAPHLYPNARTAWDNATDKHADRNFPNTVVALFWDWTSKSNGINYGHVVINVPGRGLFSSPKNWGEHGNAWYTSIDDVSSWLGASYLGWTSDLAGLKLSSFTADPTPAELRAARVAARRAARVQAREKAKRVAERRADAKAARIAARRAKKAKTLSNASRVSSANKVKSEGT